MKKSRTANAVFVVVVTLAAVWTTRSQADAPPGRYTIANGTVFDTVTGLTWQQEISPATYTWDDAQTYCAGLDLDGAGWRAPSMKEAQTLIDDSSNFNAIDLNAFPNAKAGNVWTSTPKAGGGTYRWYVSFYDGISGNDSMNISRKVRCVR